MTRSTIWIRTTCFLAVFALAALAIVGPAMAGDWAQWRGPNFNGSTDERNLPTEWSTTENIAWSVDLPGNSAATPVVWQDRVFVSSTDKANNSLLAICLDRKTGRQLWQHEVAKGISKDNRSTFSSPSPATDGKVVVFFYGNGDLVTYDLDGQKLWSKKIEDGRFAFGWTFSTSPVLFDGKLILQVLQNKSTRRDSYLLALDPQTGETIWRQVRPSQAVAESLEAFTTPTPFVIDGKKQLLVAGGDDLTCHDLETGKELWRWGTWNPERIGHWRLVPSPVAGENIVLVCAPKRDPIYAIKAGGEGQLDDSFVAWISRDQRPVSSDVPTPAYYDGDFFVLSDVRAALSRVEPQTGAVKWTTDLPRGKKYEASPLVADGKVYLVNFDGDVVVVSADSGQVLNVVSMDKPQGEDFVRASVIAAHGQLFVRTTNKLFCIGKQ
ncbi:MAG: PQQ-binding-like beta-propeller repeat protein [Pirellulaceae bacterium]|nr:PQQ-binding-like beta-propeller repeat protein [Pirellulaceae bacterium]